jgi:hypothetical protein
MISSVQYSYHECIAPVLAPVNCYLDSDCESGQYCRINTSLYSLDAQGDSVETNTEADLFYLPSGFCEEKPVDIALENQCFNNAQCSFGERCLWYPEVNGITSAGISPSVCAMGENPLVACTQEYAPVLGADGEVYSNACAAEAAGTLALEDYIEIWN